MRRFVALAAILLPASAVLVYGCDNTSEEPEVEDLCGWLGDPANCYRKFAQDIDERCGAVGELRSAEGSFALREELEECILFTQNGAAYQGGVIQFEPPLDLVALTDPTPIEPYVQNIKFLSDQGTTCGTARFTDKYDFSIAITGDPLPDAGAVPEDLVEGGAYDQAFVEGRETFNTTCPGEETHYFDRVQITKCREYEDILPHAELDLNPGAVGIPGVVRFRVYYPPPEGELSGAAPYTIEYFQCIIPPPPGPCEDELQNGNETDVDCGGPDCGRACGENQKCAADTDCTDGLTCQLEEGLRKCKE
jgi:hypothetical protein